MSVLCCFLLLNNILELFLPLVYAPQPTSQLIQRVLSSQYFWNGFTSHHLHSSQPLSGHLDDCTFSLLPPTLLLQSFLHMESRVVLLKQKSHGVSSLIKMTLGGPRPRLIPRLSHRVLRLLTSVTSLPSSPPSVISGHLGWHRCPLLSCSFWNIQLVPVIPC